jgi:hypothetical protein
MSQQEKQLSERESLALITMMINKAKDSYHDTGIVTMMWGVVITICSFEKFAEIYFNYRLLRYSCLVDSRNFNGKGISFI